MQRQTWLALGGALLALPAPAQQPLDPARLYPITTPVRDAGTLDVTTGKWTRGPSGPKGLPGLVYNNTCSFVGGASYAGFDWCEENYDEGRIPSPTDPNAPTGAQFSNEILSIQVSYCTFAGPLAGVGGYDMDLAFFDKLGGDCAGTVPTTPPSVSSQATAWFPLAGLGLPGSTGVGFQACWLVTLDTSNTGFFLASDGEGVFDGVGADDKFLWMQRQNTTVGALNLPGTPDGFFIAGEPATGGYGACTYNLPCGIDAIGGNTCGTGLDTFDASWINVDGIGVGSSGQPAGCANTVAQYGFGTNCYFFGGYPTNPLASYWLVLEAPTIACLTGKCSAYCSQSKPTSVAGCTASLSTSDLSLATGSWDATNIPREASLGSGTVVGIFIFTKGVGIGQSSFNANVPFGTLCLNGFVRSGAVLLPNAQAGVCNTGVMSRAMNNLGAPVTLAVGDDFNAQLWYRDPLPADSGNANFSNAVFGTVQ